MQSRKLYSMETKAYGMEIQVWSMEIQAWSMEMQKQGGECKNYPFFLKYNLIDFIKKKSYFLQYTFNCKVS